MGSYRKVATLSDLAPGRALAVEVEGRSLALFSVGGALYALDDECSHAGAPLCEGEFDGTVLTCPWHGATFDLASGKALSLPASLDVRSYPVRVEGDQVEVDLG